MTIAVTFAGRKRYLEILFPYIIKYKHHLQEYHIYVATQNKEDIDYIMQFYNKYPTFVKLFHHPQNIPFNRTNLWDMAYQNSTSNEVYLKIDDDIVYLEESLFTDFIQFRKDHPEYILILPWIINNVITTDEPTPLKTTWPATYQRIRPLIKNNKHKIAHYIPNQDEILCPLAWKDPAFAEKVHRTFLSSLPKQPSQEVIPLNHCEPMSIQCCAWIGTDLKQLQDTYGNIYEDEPWLTIFAPTWSNRKNCIYKDSIVSHFSYYIQEQALLKSDLLTLYKNIITADTVTVL